MGRKLLGSEEKETDEEKYHRYLIAMVPFEAMRKGVNANKECNTYHGPFKSLIMYQFAAQQGKTGK
jgi:hypothetical protein